MQKKIGYIVSKKMDKTVVVRVDTYKNHPKYDKRYLSSKKFLAHLEDLSKVNEGDKVEIVETRPYSKNKTWKVNI
jgi:small subunit ribosomal protein S17